MENILNDWKLYAFLIQGFITILCFAIIKFNDFKHLSGDVKDLSKEVKTNTTKLNKIDKKLAVSEERINQLEKSKK